MFETIQINIEFHADVFFPSIIFDNIEKVLRLFIRECFRLVDQVASDSTINSSLNFKFDSKIKLKFYHSWLNSELDVQLDSYELWIWLLSLNMILNSTLKCTLNSWLSPSL